MSFAAFPVFPTPWTEREVAFCDDETQENVRLTQEVEAVRKRLEKSRDDLTTRKRHVTRQREEVRKGRIHRKRPAFVEFYVVFPEKLDSCTCENRAEHNADFRTNGLGFKMQTF